MIEGDAFEVPQAIYKVGGMLRLGAAARVGAADKVGAGDGFSRAGDRQYIMYSEVIALKVVVIENPKWIAGILRRMYGKKKKKTN